MKNPLGTKLYYSISEVAEITDLQPYILRSWEKEFSCLRPRRMGGKNRAYKDRDIGIVLLIKHLLYEARYTSQGVKQRLKNEPELIQLVTGNSALIHQLIHQRGSRTESIATLLESGEYSEGSRDTNQGTEVGQTKLKISTPSVDIYKKLLDDTRQELKNILKMLE